MCFPLSSLDWEAWDGRASLVCFPVPAGMLCEPSTEHSLHITVDTFPVTGLWAFPLLQTADTECLLDVRLRHFCYSFGSSACGVSWSLVSVRGQLEGGDLPCFTNRSKDVGGCWLLGVSSVFGRYSEPLGDYHCVCRPDFLTH